MKIPIWKYLYKYLLLEILVGLTGCLFMFYLQSHSFNVNKNIVALITIFLLITIIIKHFKASYSIYKLIKPTKQ